MEIIVIRIIIVYWLIATFILLNLIFNSNFRLVLKDEKTGEKTEPPYWIPVLFSLNWIFFVINILFMKRGKNK